MKTDYDIIESPLITEKYTMVLAPLQQYVFRVQRHANKIEIRKAIENLYKVKVASVHTITVRGKKKRIRAQQGYTSSWKKAIVSLKEGYRIEVSKG